MKEQWLRLQQKIDGLNQRERILVLLTAVVVVVMSIQILLLDPLLHDRDLAHRQIKESSADVVKKNAEAQVIEAQLAVGVNRNKIRQRDQLKKDLGQLNQKIQASVIAMIPPQLMPEVLENLLVESKGLKLLSLENKPVVAVLTQKEITKDGAGEDNTKSSGQALYNHSFVLSLSGDYMAIIRYFEKLSGLPWQFYWDELHYQVGQYPDATVTLEVHTVSMAEEWIGV